MNTQLIREKQDLTYLTWSKIRNSSGTAGSFLKAYSELGGRKIYYKLSNYDGVRGVIGHESVNELVKSEKLHPIKLSEKNTLFLKSEVLQRNWQ